MNVLENLPTKEEFQIIPIKINISDVQSYVDGGWRYRPTSILTTYKEDWTEWYAIREFVQNSLDETGSFDLVFEDEENISYIIVPWCAAASIWRSTASEPPTSIGRRCSPSGRRSLE